MLQCISQLPFQPHQYQVETAHKVLNKMNCRALIADEVGLGKTIEAGLVIKELVHTDKTKNILILTPASLVHQWCDELFRKFDLNFWICRKGPWGWDYNFVIGSLDKAKRPEHREMILSRDYDLVIVDEAHKLKNKKTANWKLVNDINTRGLLLLTATPLQNNMEEVYNLLSLIKPSLRDYHNFLEYYDIDSKIMLSELKDKLSDLMVRNLNKDQVEKKVSRNVRLIPIRLRPEEKEIYDCLKKYRGSFLRLTLQKEYASSPSAVYATLQKMGEEYLLRKLEEVPLPMKVYHLQGILQNHPGSKVLIFTEYVQTGYFIGRWLDQLGYTYIHFNGKLKRNQKEYTKWLFENKDYKVMVCTDSGSQGLNFQFCDVMVNFDLPWNPMKVEQRIGRIDRLGQTSEKVWIYNFVLQETVEEKIFSILGNKIALFKECIGELDNILTGDTAELSQEELMQVMYKL